MNILLLSVAILLAIGSLVIKKSVPAIISFVLMMFTLGLYYINLDAKVLGLFQIFVYTGGIMVLILFGVTIIGLEFPDSKLKPRNAFFSALFFLLVSILFFRGLYTLEIVHPKEVEDVALFSNSFSDFVIIFALIGSSLLYATAKMAKTLKAKRIKDV
jgi:NADH-quinone oxidoreductase subunit J